jgi:hypothetical protein
MVATRILGAPFHTSYRPRRGESPPTARRPILARALRADVATPNLGPVLVWGEPLIGKSTLVRQVLWSLPPERFLVARLPLGATAEPLSEYSRAVRLLAEQITVQLESRGPEPDFVGSVRSLTEAVDHALAAAEATRRVLVLALEGVDRYVGGAWPDGVRRNLEAVLERVPHLGLVMTARLPPTRLEGLERVEPVRVHFVPRLEAAESERLLTHPVSGWLDYEEDALRWMLAAAGGRPYLLQIMGRNAVRVARQSDAGRVTPELAQEILTSCWLAGEHVFRPLLGNLDAATQRALAAVALATSPEHPTAELETIHQYLQAFDEGAGADTFGEELSRLRRWRLVESDERGAFWVGCGWLADYLRAGLA